MSKKCEKCGMEYEDSISECPACSGKAEADINAEKEQDKPAENPAEASSDKTEKADKADESAKKDTKVSEAAASAAASVKNAVKIAAESVKESASGLANNKELQEKVKKADFKKIGIAAVAAVVVIVLISVIFGSPYKKPLDNLINGISSSNGRMIKNAFPKYEAREIEDYYDFDDIAEEMHDSLEDEYGKFKITYEIRRKDKIAKGDLRDLEDSIEDTYDKKVKVSAGYELKVKMQIKGRDDSDKTTTTIAVYKIDGKWCITSNGLLYGSIF